jgi:hypothetical protein
VKGQEGGENCITRSFVTCSRSMVWVGNVARIGKVIGEKARRKETTRKTKAYIG